MQTQINTLKCKLKSQLKKGYWWLIFTLSQCILAKLCVDYKVHWVVAALLSLKSVFAVGETLSNFYSQSSNSWETHSNPAHILDNIRSW